MDGRKGVDEWQTCKRENFFFLPAHVKWNENKFDWIGTNILLLIRDL